MLVQIGLDSISEMMRCIGNTMCLVDNERDTSEIEEEDRSLLTRGKGAARSSANLPHSRRGEDDAGSLRWQKGVFEVKHWTGKEHGGRRWQGQALGPG